MDWLIFFPELIGAGIGAFLGFLFAVRVERQSRREEDVEERKSVLESLLQELDYNYSVLGDNSLILVKILHDGKIKVDTNPLITSMFQSIVASGKLTLLPPLLQFKLADYHARSNSIMTRVKIIESMAPSNARVISDYLKEIKEKSNELNDWISYIESNLKKELN